MDKNTKTPAKSRFAMLEEAGESVRSAFGDAIGKIGPVTNRKLASFLESYRDSIVDQVVDGVRDKLDAMSGKAILEELEQYVKQQAIYNDVLAAKLYDALKRIEVLEARAR